MRARPSFFALLGMLGVHSALVAFLTWPLVRQLNTHLPATSGACEFDPLYMGWTLAHQSRALLTAPATLSDGGIYQPTANSWLYGETSSGALPLFLPVFLVSGNPTLALNAVFLAGVALTAVALQAVVLDWTGSWLAGLVAAWTFLTTRWVLWEHLPCAPSHAMLPALPLIIALASRRVLGVRAWLGLLLLVILQCLTNLVYVAPVVLATLTVLAVVRLARAPRSGAALGAVIAAAVLALAPLYVAHCSVWLANPRLAEQTVWPLSGPLEPAPSATSSTTDRWPSPRRRCFSSSSDWRRREPRCCAARRRATPRNEVGRGCTPFSGPRVESWSPCCSHSARVGDGC